MSQAGVAEHMQTVKYPAARAAIALLKDAGLRVLHVGSPAFDPWRPAGVYYFDDLDLLIRDADLAAFRATMEGAGYRFILDDPHTQTASEAPPDLVEKLLSRPNDPHIGYAPEVKFALLR